MRDAELMSKRKIPHPTRKKEKISNDEQAEVEEKETEIDTPMCRSVYAGGESPRRVAIVVAKNY